MIGLDAIAALPLVAQVAAAVVLAWTGLNAIVLVWLTLKLFD